jgi:demethylmenaquinone methyltransferase/2-methoxy-6-polyprenyl-1,4-benzoquinol methylase
LDFNRTEGAPAQLQSFALRNLVVPLASQLGFQREYAYLETSIARFPSGKEQLALAKAAGFSGSRHRPLAGALMGLLELSC